MIDVAGLYRDICQALGAGYANERLADQFPRAFNRALNDLAVNSDHAVWPDVQGTEGTLDFPAQYEYVLFAGIQYYLIRSGHAPADPKIANVVYQDSAQAWKDGKGDFVMNEDNIKQHDPANSMIGLGSVVNPLHKWV